MISSELHSIFPSPVYRSKLTRKFTEKELHFVKKMKTKCRPNAGNTTTSDNYILNTPSFAALKKEVQLFVEDYFAKILFPPKSISPYITQSWINYTDPKGFHQKHAHGNSYLSGVLYISAESPHDKITFDRNRYEQIKFHPTQWNLFNSDHWFFPISTGEIIIFPSYMTHFVEPTQGRNTRISLSFNVFLKGNLGNKNELTELTL